MVPVMAFPVRTHRLALCVSGGIALGSYEAGVLTQLYHDLHTFNRHPDIQGKARVVIDAIAGASAGSITGLILAQALSLGLPPAVLETRMRACWVELLSIENLLKPSATDHSQSLFTAGVVEDVVKAGVDLFPQPPLEEQEAVALWITMTNLDGVPFVIDFKRHDQPHAQVTTELYALDYRDHVPFLLEGNAITMTDARMNVGGAGEGTEPDGSVWQLAVQAARASSAFPVAFPSQYQARDLTHYAGYMRFKEEVETSRLPEKAGEPHLQAMEPLPTTASFQFVDGGLFNNEPLGKCIDAVEELNRRFPTRDPDSPASQGKAGRSFLIIEPEPQLPHDIAASLTVSTQPPDKPLLPHAVLSKVLSAYFNSALYGDFQNAAKVNRQLLDLDAALSRLDTLGLDAERATQVEAIKTAIRQAVGLDKKSQITLRRIPADVPAARRLAGAFGGHFGGFLRRDYREADFLTGQHEARQWLTKWLTLWLQSHADDVDRQEADITEEFVAGLLGKAPPDSDNTPLAPTGLTPVQLAQAGWFPDRNADGEVTEEARRAALTPEEWQRIIQLAEARGETLLDAWLHVSPLAHFGVHLAAGALEQLFNGRFLNEPETE